MQDAAGKKPNRLLKEKSPYLLQHAYNPVDWYPWSEEAFAAARKADKPIFLSIGYATCHWCHVMERESFEDESTAKVMNENYINIKVDREEHPDVDQIYMAAVQATTGHGGWPMSVFLTPERQPFYAGTYFPPESRWGHPAFKDVLRQLSTAWKTQREKVLKNSAAILEALSRREGAGLNAELNGRAPIEGAIRQLERSFDARYGGFGQAPKFPRSMTLMLILRDRLHREDPDNSRLEMVEKTLDMMWRGGLYDHVGGGFARYSTDEQWMVPHFEKMLYDNALLILAYTEAWQVTGKPEWRHVVYDVVRWIEREMTDPSGGFYSAKDADSEGVEGKFYVWTPEEVKRVLGEKDAEFAIQVFGITEHGNFEGENILHLPHSIDETALHLKMDRSEFLTRLESLRERLYAARSKRVPPLLDDKILTSWNGLLIGALARAGAALSEPRFLNLAERAARFLSDQMWREGVLLRRFRAGESRFNGTLEDYSFFAFGLFELFKAGGNPVWFDLARKLVGETDARFRDSEAGGYFFTEKNAEHLILRMKEPYDGAMPAGNSMAIANLIELAALTNDSVLRERAAADIAAFAGEVTRGGMAYPMLLICWDRLLTPSAEIVVARAAASGDDKLLTAVRRVFQPHSVILGLSPEHAEAVAAYLPWTKGKGPVEGKTAAWICRNFSCEAPITDPAQVKF